MAARFAGAGIGVDKINIFNGETFSCAIRRMSRPRDPGLQKFLKTWTGPVVFDDWSELYRTIGQNERQAVFIHRPFQFWSVVKNGRDVMLMLRLVHEIRIGN